MRIAFIGDLQYADAQEERLSYKFQQINDLKQDLFDSDDYYGNELKEKPFKLKSGEDNSKYITIIEEK